MPSYIGIDYGLANIGVAVGQSITQTATALQTIHIKHKFNWAELDKIIKQWQPDAIIIGLPLTEDGHTQLITKQVLNFAKKLISRYQLPVHEVDERYSSIQAQEEFAIARKQGNAKRKQGKYLDAHAAKNILQRWLDGI
ncbi:Putative pre-16S rRNA nuclease Yqg [hydrothermal vent metagenome]|uniref:Pre-16S rRNA nuclease Yqg n=1 Tax=hydrothermal vent metagenome TaxID=652676 RepID=A0A3B0WD01_9ZZZZ